MTPVSAPLEFQFGRRRFDFASRTHIMGVLNVTPDSFSDGGRYFDPDRAVDHALAMIGDGADIIDVGGESTRPRGAAYGGGADPVPANEELSRVLPVIERLAAATDAPISVDTYKAEVAREALRAGACIVNDISGFRMDEQMPAVVAAAGASAVVMHMQGTPRTMQLNPTYGDLFVEITAFLRDALERGRRAGIQQLFVDPGLGFGKTMGDNVRLIAGLQRFRDLGCPVVVGPSRKAFLGAILNLPVEQRLEGTLAAVAACVLRGAHVVRVHDVREARRVVLVADAVRREMPPLD
jgi:dihydropteroate synthase